MIFDATEIIGKTLFGNENVKIYHLPTLTSEIIKTIPVGQPIGVVYSYIEREGNLWWMFENSGYAIHEKGKFSEKALFEQGAIDEASKNLPDKLLMLLKKTATWAIPLTAVIIAIYWISKTYKNLKS